MTIVVRLVSRGIVHDHTLDRTDFGITPDVDRTDAAALRAHRNASLNIIPAYRS